MALVGRSKILHSSEALLMPEVQVKTSKEEINRCVALFTPQRESKKQALVEEWK